MKLNHLQQTIDFDDMFADSPDLICIASKDGYFEKVNPVVIKTLGYELPELLEKPISSFVEPNEHTTTSAKDAQDVPWLNSENRYLTKSGGVVWISWTSTQLESQQLILAIGKNTTKKNQPSASHKAGDLAWLAKFEHTIRKHSKKIDLNLNIICDELAIGERQLFRRTRTILGVTPNQYVQKIRLQIAMEAIQNGKCKTLSEVSYAAGFRTPSYFKKLFEKNYNVAIENLL